MSDLFKQVQLLMYMISACLHLRLKMLPVEFQELPAQASRYKVEGVIPASGNIWREKDGLAMVNTLENKAMVASITVSRRVA